jgi:arylsulfatase A-like enzyme
MPVRILGFRTCSVLACVGLVGAGCSDPPPPSVILISLDTVRADRFGVYGYERATTPHLDALARESTVWEHAYTTASWTLIAHMGMFTGLWPHQHGVVTGESALAPEIPTLAERLAARGYDTRGFYEPGWIHERHGFARGFNVFVPHRDAAGAQANVARSLAELDEDRPLFLFIHLFDAHSAELDAEDRLVYQPPEPYDRQFISDAPDRFEAGDALRIFDGGEEPTPEQAEALNALYDGGVRYLDEVVGRWIDEWRASGLLDRSILIVTSDHGEALGERELGFGNHGAMWEEGLRVPMIVRLPHGEGGGRRMRGPSSLTSTSRSIRGSWAIR